MFTNWKRKYDRACLEYNACLDEEKEIIRARDTEIRQLKVKTAEDADALSRLKEKCAMADAEIKRLTAKTADLEVALAAKPEEPKMAATGGAYTPAKEAPADKPKPKRPRAKK